MRELPSGWVRAGFGQIFDFKGGSQPPKSTFSDHPLSGYVRLLQIRDFESDAKAVFIKDHSRWPKCSADDIMIGRYGASVGKILTGKAGAYNVALVRLIFDRELLDASWVRLFLLSDYFQAPLTKISRSAQNGFNKGDLEEIEVPLAPLPEQRRIVAKIDSLSGKSKRARDHLDHIPRLVEKYKQAILAAAFRGELTREWRLRSGCGDTWDKTTLGQLLVDICYGTAKKCGYEAGATAVLRIPNIQLGRITLDDVKSADFNEKELRKLRLQVGDILVIRSNGSLDLVGRSAVVDDAAAGMLFAGYLIRLRLNSDLADPQFVQLYLRASETRAHVEQFAKSTSGVNNINSTQLQQLSLLRPSVDEQREITSRVNAAFAWIDSLATNATSARKLIDHLDQAVLAKAFRGELVLQDLNDEPASVLLERIRLAHDTSTNNKSARRHKRSEGSKRP